MTDPATLEAYACREALVLAEDLGLRKLKIASDCLTVINDLHAPIQMGGYCMVLREIQNRRTQFQASEFSHEQRICNKEAHHIPRLFFFKKKTFDLFINYQGST